ncbi:MAG: hypothetical protein GTO30_22605, partial [Acidobacteria bacterium]|nr:hypothetical protein [Acidobacteriota bacterium]NIQ86510.1 hypothetical protein [Acidobacteriota bacterium]
ATILEYRADQGGAIVEVPVSLTAGSYQITVTNTDSGVTSDPACIELGAGPYTPVCTISGNVTDSGGSVMDALVFVDLNGKFVRAAVTDASGN